MSRYTADGEELPFDLLLLAPGAVPAVALPGALCFRGPAEAAELTQMLEDALAGEVESFVFAIPSGAGWALPLYELALAHPGTARRRLRATGRRRHDRHSGGRAARAVRRDGELGDGSSCLRSAASSSSTARRRSAFADGELQIAPGGSIRRGPGGGAAAARRPAPTTASPCDAHGLPTDRSIRTGVWRDRHLGRRATRPASHSSRVESPPSRRTRPPSRSPPAPAPPVEPSPFRPVLRGLLLTGMSPRFLRAEGSPAVSVIDTEPLWWPPAKIVGRYLAPFLAQHLGTLRGPARRERAKRRCRSRSSSAPGRPRDWSEV